MSFFQNLMGGPASGARVDTISGETAVKFFGDRDTVFVDVRTPGEIEASGTVKGALKVPLQEFARHARPDGRGSLPAAGAGKRIILVCASGARSAAAAEQLVQMGYAEVANLRGGIGAWFRAGGPVGR
jgi:rhodanese-related sulfurtransferase